MPVLTQRVDVKCDTCGKEYNSSLFNRNSHIKTYNIDLCRSCKQKVQYSSGLREKQKEHCKKLAAEQTGKTIDLLYGPERAKEIRSKLSDATKGDRNPMYGKSHQCVVATSIFKSWKGKTLEEIYGLKRAKEIRSKLSDATKGDRNPMYGKPTPIGSGNGWSGWYKGNYFRSIMELSYLKYLYDNNIKFISAESKQYAIQYEINGTKRNYFYDYILDNGTHIEIKPKNLIDSVQNKLKFEAAKQKLGNSFVILTEYDIAMLTTDDIKFLYEHGEVSFIKRYDDKFKEKYYGIKPV